MGPERQYWIGFNLVRGVGPVRTRRLLERFGALSEAWHAPVSSLAEAGLDRRAVESLKETRRRVDLAAELARLDKLGIAILTWEDKDYPALLKQLQAIDQAPPLLYMRGSLSSSDEWALAVVGTRTASAYGRQVAHRLTRELAANGLVIISGLARGIDAEAHRAALDVGQRTIAVLPCGLDTIYPPENRLLAAEIIRHGAVMSIFPLGAKPERRRFAPRNQLMSGLARGVLVIEAGEKSGALLTATSAAEQGREVFAVPGNITARGSNGTNQLIREGATPVTSAEDVLMALELEHIAQYTDARTALPEMSDDERQVLNHLSGEALHVDELAQRCGLPIQTVNSVLTMLELKGTVRQVGPMIYAKI